MSTSDAASEWILTVPVDDAEGTPDVGNAERYLGRMGRNAEAGSAFMGSGYLGGIGGNESASPARGLPVAEVDRPGVDDLVALRDLETLVVRNGRINVSWLYPDALTNCYWSGAFEEEGQVLV